jgi:hypothetical protein
MMSVTAVELYKALSGKIGDREAELLVEFVESSVKEAAVTKEDLLRFEAALREEISGFKKEFREEINRLDRRITDLEWKMKLYFAVIAALIILTNPKVMEIAGRVFGFVK